MQYVVYIGKSNYFFAFFFLICSCFSEDNRIILVLFFLFLTLVWIVTTSFDKFKLQCQKRLSQINVLLPIRLKFKLYAVFKSELVYCSCEDRTSSTIWTFPPRFADTATKGWYRNLLFDMISEKYL